MQTNPRIHQLDATATAKRLVQKNPNRVGLTVFNNELSNKPEVISKENDAYGTGIPIAAKGCYENLHYCQGEYWVICDTGETADLRIEEDIREVE